MNIYLDTIGCRLNQAEIELMARQFREAGHQIAGSPESADLAVVNTCAVTTEAASDSRGKIRQIARSGAEKIIVTGCWATLQPMEAAALPHVARVVVNATKDQLVLDVLDRPAEPFEMEPISRVPLPGLRQRTRAFIKVQDGCDNHCTFCITTIARGAGRSRALGDILHDIQLAERGGTKEIVLTGVHLGSWGKDLGLHLRHLVRGILAETGVPRLRLSSLEPWDLDQDFFRLWENPRLCRQLHLPVQSGCAATLKRMARKTHPASFRMLVQAARQVMPEVAITTDVIAGFPGETQSEFDESLAFVQEMEFAGGHAFTYSPRPGTAAARMAGQVAMEVRRERNAAYRRVFDGGAETYRRRFIGRRLQVLWESSTQLDERGWQMEGWTDNYLRVSAIAPKPIWNELSDVTLQTAEEARLVGQIAV